MKYLYTFVLFFLFLGSAPDILERPKPAEPVRSTSGSCVNDFDALNTNPDDYLWPTDASTRITSSFAEYRSMHYHGGLDISTNGEVGYNVFAVRDGYLYRISILPNGYGKTLLIKHRDGFYSFYVHLQKFNDKIEEITKQEQIKRGSFFIEKTFDNPIVEVKKGEVIAFTGETGVGPPHLHFEIRDENMNNVNPLLIYGDALKDNIAPSINGLALFPIGVNSTIEGKSAPKYLGRLNRHKGKYTVPQTIRIHGEVGFGIRAFDRADGNRDKSGVYRLEFYVDDKLTFAKQLDRFPALQTKQIYLDYDYPTILQGKGEYQKLFVEEGTSLPFYGNLVNGDGVINTQAMSEGEHTYRIVCKDFKNNASMLEGSLFVNHTPSIEISSVENEKIILTSPERETLTKFTIFTKRLSDKKWIQTNLKKTSIQLVDSTIILSFNSTKYDALKIVAESKLGIASKPALYFMKKPQTSPTPITLDFRQMANHIRATISTAGIFTSTPVFTVKTGTTLQTIPVEMQSLSEYTACLLPSQLSAGMHTSQVSAEVNGTRTTASEVLDLFAITPAMSGSFSTGSSGVIISYNADAVYQPMVLQIQNLSTPTTTKYTLGPTNLILNDGFQVSIPVRTSQCTEKHGLYFRGNGGWSFQKSLQENNMEFVSTKLTRTLGELAIFKDEQPPSIGRLRFNQSKGFVNGNFKYSDNLSGVDYEGLKIYVDDQLVIPEVDDEHHRVWFKSDEQLPAGKHNLTITLRDKVKNEAKVTKTFTVKQGKP
ncbi:MAG: M23 family metallopeptidase, partial [Bacteroidetes bacterium]